MQDFTYQNTTKIFFGDYIDAELKNAVSQFGTRVLLVTGGQSVHRSGLYDRVQRLLTGLTLVDLAGVEPNPKIDSVRDGQRLAKAQAIDVVLAVGGGSVIDCAKVVATAANYAGDPWDLVLDRELSRATPQLPIVTILTLSATGSEMNDGAVISNPATKEKIGTSGAHTPAVSFEDPRLTTTVPARQTAAGSMDIFSHLCEQYFDREPANDATKGMIEGLMRAVIKWAPVAIAEPDNLAARSNLMWTATSALNGSLRLGNRNAWSNHAMEHVLSAYYDITHGVGLGILTPRWLHYVATHDGSTQPLIARFGRNVWGLTGDDAAVAPAAIAATYDWIASLGFPMTLPGVGIADDRDFSAMAAAAAPRLTDAYLPLDATAVETIYRAAQTPGLQA